MNVQVPFSLASRPSTFAVRVAHPDYSKPLQVSAFIRGSWRPLPNDLIDSWSGFKHFLNAAWTDAKGHTLLARPIDWWPNDGTPSRLSLGADPTPTFISWCPSHPFARGMMWGINTG